jgi:hypothetical protein
LQAYYRQTSIIKDCKEENNINMRPFGFKPGRKKGLCGGAVSLLLILIKQIKEDFE